MGGRALKIGIDAGVLVEVWRLRSRLEDCEQ